MYARLKNRLNNATSTTLTRKLILFFKWKLKNWITFATVIAINANHNNAYKNNEMKQNESYNNFDNDLKSIIFLIK